MADDKKYFLYKKQYPDVLSILNGQKLNLEEFSKSAVFVIDTNSLLVPYQLKQESLNEIGKIYHSLLNSGRLFVSAHTLREFAKHRSPKISELFMEVDRALSNIPTISELEYPILQELEPYKKLQKFREDFISFIKPYKPLLKELQSNINEWNWSDPVTNLYSQVFASSNIIDNSEDDGTLEVEFEERMKLDIPPGNKDAEKKVNAIGDFLIWKAILDLGKKKQLDIVLVTNDEKNDWMLKSNKKSISPRFELVDEFGRVTGGRQFTCLSFPTFLKIQGADQQIVSEVVTASVVNKSHDDFTPNAEHCLHQLKIILTEYINYHHEADDHYIQDISFEQLAKETIALIQNGHLDLFTESQSFTATLVIYLNDLLKHNYVVHYQSIRMKRNTFFEQSELKRIAKLAVAVIDELFFTLI